MGDTVRIGIAARESGLAPSAIRYYEAAGVLPPAALGHSGYRRYSADDVRRLSFARKARTLGLPLADVQALVALAFDGECETYVHDLVGRVRARRTEVEQQLAALDALRVELEPLARDASCDDETCDAVRALDEADGGPSPAATDLDSCLGGLCASAAPAEPGRTMLHATGM
ncbi:MAG: MerR family transcriptional regulator [Chloroflexi bacterium]|nr:MerR family transcriptional regulator [Chloroflexota bacterium]